MSAGKRPAARYQDGVALTFEESNSTWYVVTDPIHPHGADTVGYPSYTDALEGFRLAVKAVEE